MECGHNVDAAILSRRKGRLKMDGLQFDGRQFWLGGGKNEYLAIGPADPLME
jgi:hypothetical protein